MEATDLGVECLKLRAEVQRLRALLADIIRQWEGDWKGRCEDCHAVDAIVAARDHLEPRA